MWRERVPPRKRRTDTRLESSPSSGSSALTGLCTLLGTKCNRGEPLSSGWRSKGHGEPATLQREVASPSLRVPALGAAAGGTAEHAFAGFATLPLKFPFVRDDEVPAPRLCLFGSHTQARRHAYVRRPHGYSSGLVEDLMARTVIKFRSLLGRSTIASPIVLPAAGAHALGSNTRIGIVSPYMVNYRRSEGDSRSDPEDV
jgi:hypothetical protein